jgi:hypothetical protein
MLSVILFRDLKAASLTLKKHTEAACAFYKKSACDNYNWTFSLQANEGPTPENIDQSQSREV